MSTTAKGREFADKIYARVSELVQAGGFPFSAETCKAFREKGYLSPRRRSLINLDITVELWPQNAERWSLLWAFECKDHATPIKDSHLAKFFTQLEEVAPCNKKGVVVTTSTFTKDALMYASETGMGLIRILPDSQVDYVMHGRKTAFVLGEKNGSSSQEMPFLQLDYRGQNNRVYAIAGNTIVHSIKDLLIEMSKST